MIEKQRKDPNFALKCKACVEAKGQEIRAAAAANAKLKAEETAGAAGETADSLHECSACKANLQKAAFNRNQLRNKGPGKQRCQTCVQQTEVEEKDKLKANQTAGLNAARHLKSSSGRGSRRSWPKTGCGFASVRTGGTAGDQS